MRWVLSVLFRVMKFRLIDQVIAQEPRSIVAVKNVTEAEEYLSDHFPSFPVLPGVMMVEAMVQAARLLLEPTHSRQVLGSIRALRYGSFVRPGEALRVEVEWMKTSEDGIHTFRGEGKVMPLGAAIEDLDTAVSGRFTMRPLRTERCRPPLDVESSVVGRS